MYAFFRSGDNTLNTIMKFEINKSMIAPFVDQLSTMQILLANLVFSIQVGFFIGIVIGCIFVSLALMNLVKDYKEKIILGRQGKYPGFIMEEVEVKDSANFPGFVISTSVAGFVITVGVITIVFTLLTQVLFWLLLWEYRFTLLTVIIPAYATEVIQGYIQDYVYEEKYVKNRSLAGILDSFYFFLAILSGLGAAIGRFQNALIALLVAQCRLNAPCLPEWVLKIKYLDDFHKCYMTYIYLQCTHNNPTTVYVADILSKISSKKNENRAFGNQGTSVSTPSKTKVSPDDSVSSSEGQIVIKAPMKQTLI
jgi:hypothetical protein